MNARPVHLITPLLLALGLMTVASPAATADPGPPGAATARPAATDDDPGYPIRRFHARRDDNPRLVRAWSAWKSSDRKRYTTVVQRVCFCIDEPDLETVVRRGAVTSVTFEGRRRELNRDGYEMDAIFRVLRRAYRTAEYLEVSYRRGVPVSLFVDGDRLVADDEFRLNVAVIDTDPAEPVAYPVGPTG